jgi:hypothetical protein
VALVDLAGDALGEEVEEDGERARLSRRKMTWMMTWVPL